MPYSKVSSIWRVIGHLASIVSVVFTHSGEYEIPVFLLQVLTTFFCPSPIFHPQFLHLPHPVHQPSPLYTNLPPPLANIHPIPPLCLGCPYVGPPQWCVLPGLFITSDPPACCLCCHHPLCPLICYGFSVACSHGCWSLYIFWLACT